MYASRSSHAIVAAATDLGRADFAAANEGVRRGHADVELLRYLRSGEGAGVHGGERRRASPQPARWLRALRCSRLAKNVRGIGR